MPYETRNAILPHESKETVGERHGSSSYVPPLQKVGCGVVTLEGHKNVSFSFVFLDCGMSFVV